MLAERWRRIESLFHEALGRSAEERASFLDDACSNDTALRREVESLLAHEGLASAFLEPDESSAPQAMGVPAQVAFGERIGPYTVVALLGAGGMGEVHKAYDHRLDRHVAIKFLSRRMAQDPASFGRFEEEARAASALNHPNICTVYDVGEFRGRPYLVMELLEGQSLKVRIAQKALRAQEIASIGGQVCDALQVAHDKKIVHRDIKPANVFITHGGHVKVLDFGLAKRCVRPTPPPSDASAQSLTLMVAGTVEGTLAYMSPEQAVGADVDTRSDIFSLGVVLYEMATGRLPFRGKTPAGIVGSILTESPAKPSSVNTAIPFKLDRLILKALEKEAGNRHQSAQELAGDLAALTGTPWRRPLIAVSALALLAALAAMIWLARQPTLGPRPQFFTQLTDTPGEELYPSLSSDGKSFVYQSGSSGHHEIYWKRVGGGNPISLSKDSASDDKQPAFSPDGDHVAFRSERDGGGIFIMGATGENVRRLTNFGYNPSWAPDGKEVVFSTQTFVRPEERGPNPDAQLFRVNVTSGEMRRIPGIEDALEPSWSPHGYRIAYWNSPTGVRNISTVAAGGGDPVPVTADTALDWSPIWSPDGRYLYFASDRGGSMNLWRVRIDERSGKSRGAPEPVTTPAASSGLMSFSPDGRRMLYAAQARDLNLYKIGFDPSREARTGEPVPITQGSKPLADPDFSPDGKWIVFNTRLTPQNLFVVRSDGTGLHQITDGEQMDRCPRWSPDGQQILFFSTRTGRWQTYTVRPDGSRVERHTDAPGNGARLPKWSPDGRRVIYVVNGKVAIMDPARAWNDQSMLVLPDPGSGVRFAVDAWSPDGSVLAGEIKRTDGTPVGLAIYHLDSQTYERLGPVETAPNCRWLADSRRLLFVHDGKLHLIDVRSRRVHPVFSPGPRRDIQTFDISRDGGWIAFTVEAAESDVWLANLR